VLTSVAGAPSSASLAVTSEQVSVTTAAALAVITAAASAEVASAAD